MSDDCESCASGKWPAYGADEQPDYENLNDLIDEVAAKYPGEQLRIRQKDLPRLMLKRLTVKRMLSNLITNALKYGALSAPQGHVDIQWSVDPDDQLLIEWAERGGPAVRPPERRGFGSRIVELALPNELGGKVALDYRSDGLRCSIRSPLSALDKNDAFMPLG